MFPTDIEYYRRRAAAERRNATLAERNAAKIHEELARRYEALIEQERRASVHIVNPDRVSA